MFSLIRGKYIGFSTFYDLNNFSVPILSDRYILGLDRSLPTDFVRLDQDILTPLAGKKQLYVYETRDFWEQIKTPG